MNYIHKYCVLAAISALLASTCMSQAAFSAPADSPATEQKAASDKESPVKPPAIPFGEYLAGKFAESNGDSDNSVKFLRESLAHDPNNTEIMGNVYNALIATGDIEGAVKIATKLGDKKIPDQNSEFPPELILMIEACKQGHYDEAKKYLQAMPKVGFNSVLLPLLQAWMRLATGEIKAPLDAKDIFPNGKMLLAHIYLNAAFINEIAGFDSVAAGQYETATTETGLESPRAAEALANYYYRKGDKDKYSQFIAKYTASHGETVLNNQPFSTTPIKPLVGNINEGMAEAFYTVSSIFHGVRTPADEITTLKIALYLRPDFPVADFLLAGAYELKHSFQLAIDSYKAIKSDSPYYTQAQIMIAYDESELGHKEQALAALDKISEEHPHEISALLAKGDIMRANDKYEQAIEAYNAALARLKSPRKPHWIIYFSRGICYDRIGNFEKTEADLKKALALSPGEPDVLNYLGYSWLIKHRNIAEAKKMIGEAYDARPEDAQIIDSMGYALYTDGDFTSAQEYFEQALERIPNDPTVNEHLGDTYWQLGRKTEAGYQWQRALDNKPDEEDKKALLKKLENGMAMITPSAASGKKLPKSAVQ